jgi:VWFA-related protein
MLVFRRVVAPGIAFFLLVLAAGAQVSSVPNNNSQDQPPLFKSKVNLIMAPVVVRDKKGNAVGTLEREDFQLFDNGEPQVISSFSVEALPANSTALIPSAGRTKAAQPAAPSAVAPDRFIGFYIDDVHLEFGDLAQARAKLQKLISTRLKPGDRAAIFTTSGQTVLDFTDDWDKLNRTVLKIAPHPFSLPMTCPVMTVLQADRIANYADSDLIAKKGVEAVPTCAKDAEEGKSRAISAAAMIIGAVELSVRNVLTDMRSVVRLMGEKPGQRILVLASSGFIRPTPMLGDNALIDEAIRSKVVINALDARGLVAPTGRRPWSPAQEAAQSGILWALARGTGGKFINNTNDLGGALARLAEAPEFTYMLGFAPENLTLDGKFHSLKVTVKAERGLDVQARIGYYAPTHLASAGESAKAELRQALFGQEETHAIPIYMTAELAKISDSETKLTITASVDISKLHYRKVDGKNSNDVEVVCGLFDRNGGYIGGVSNTITLRLVDNVAFNRENGTVPVRTEFKVAPGAYRIRLVARDSEGEMMTAQSGSVDTEMAPAPAVAETSTPTLPPAPPALAQEPAAVNADPVLERGREKALAYARSLPDFVCAEIIRRYKRSQTPVLLPGTGPASTASGAPSWAPLDKLTVRLSFFEQKENHKLELVNDRPTSLQYVSLDIGVTSTGQFGGMLQRIFDPSSQASFRWKSSRTARRRRVAVYSYAVAADHSRFFVERGSLSGEAHRAVVGFHGTVEIDTGTGDVLHLDYTADNVPRTVALTRSVTSVDFDRVDVGGSPYILPVRAETELEGPNLAFKNAIEFREFRKFGASSTVDFGVGK